MRVIELLNEFLKKKKRVRKWYVKNAKEAKRHGSRLGTFLVVQWLRLHALKAGAWGLIPDQELDPTCHN